MLPPHPGQVGAEYAVSLSEQERQVGALKVLESGMQVSQCTWLGLRDFVSTVYTVQLCRSKSQYTESLFPTHGAGMDNLTGCRGQKILLLSGGKDGLKEFHIFSARQNDPPDGIAQNDQNMGKTWASLITSLEMCEQSKHAAVKPAEISHNLG